VVMMKSPNLGGISLGVLARRRRNGRGKKKNIKGDKRRKMKVGDELFLRKANEPGEAYLSNEGMKHEYKVNLSELAAWYRGDKLFCTFKVVKKE